MKPIIEYKDYHSYIKDFYEDRKRFSYFSWREFAKLAGFSSPTYLRLVSEGKSNLSRVTMNRMISAMGLAGFEADYFKALVNFCNAKDDDAKMPFWKEMRKIALEYKVRVVDKEAVEYFDGWICTWLFFMNCESLNLLFNEKKNYLLDYIKIDD